MAAIMIVGAPVPGSAAFIEVSSALISDGALAAMDDVVFEVRIDGRIELGDADAFQRKLLHELDKVEEASKIHLWMDLNSPGGHVKDAFEIGRIARAMAAATRVKPDQRCDSSCALIFVAGVGRWNRGVVGVHRPYFVVQPNSPSPSGSDIAALRTLTLDYLREMNVPDQLGTRLLDTPPRDIYLLRGSEIHAYVSSIDPVFEDLSALRDARRHGLDTASYFRLINAAKELARHTCPPQDLLCDLSTKYELLWGLDREELKARRKAVQSKCLISPSEKAQVTARVKQQAAAAITRRLPGYLDPEKEHPALKRHRDCVIEVMRGRR